MISERGIIWRGFGAEPRYHQPGFDRRRWHRCPQPVNQPAIDHFDIIQAAF
jgi:hypothetical protein